MATPKPPQRRPTTIHSLHQFKSSWVASVNMGTSPQDELLQHSRYIRDYLAPHLFDDASLPPGEMALLSSVMNRIAVIPMTISLLRYSRIEKALMMVAYTFQECWPVDLVSNILFGLLASFVTLQEFGAVVRVWLLLCTSRHHRVVQSRAC